MVVFVRLYSVVVSTLVVVHGNQFPMGLWTRTFPYDGLPSSIFVSIFHASSARKAGDSVGCAAAAFEPKYRVLPYSPGQRHVSPGGMVAIGSSEKPELDIRPAGTLMPGRESLSPPENATPA